MPGFFLGVTPNYFLQAFTFKVEPALPPRTCRYSQVETRYDRATSAKMAGAQDVIYLQTRKSLRLNRLGVL